VNWQDYESCSIVFLTENLVRFLSVECKQLTNIYQNTPYMGYFFLSLLDEVCQIYVLTTEDCIVSGWIALTVTRGNMWNKTGEAMVK
jgi:uncharacterized membrane protein YkgB